MTVKKPIVLGWVCFLTVWTALIVGAHALDDPLDAFPTQKRPVEVRVQGLTDAELKKIELPMDGEQLVLSIALGARDPKNEEAVIAKPRLQVYADGRIDCGSQIEPNAERATDKLTMPELKWLLHLAVNECRLLSQSTNEIEAKLHAHRQKVSLRPERFRLPEPPGLTDHYHYRVELPVGRNDLLLPERALMLRPLRTRMNLGAFASLHKYERFLVGRAYLGDEEQRQEILNQLNGELKAKDANLPPFQIEHLTGAGPGPIKGSNFFAEFDNKVDLGDNRVQRIVGIFTRKDKDGKPTIVISSNQYTKYRPFAQP